MTEQLHQTGKSRSSSVDSNSVEGTETDAPDLREIACELLVYADLVRDGVPFSLGVPTFERWAAACRAAEARADLLQQERDRLLVALTEARDIIRSSYSDEALAEGYWPTLKPQTDRLDAVLRDSSLSQSGSAIATPHGGTETDPS